MLQWIGSQRVEHDSVTEQQLLLLLLLVLLPQLLGFPPSSVGKESACNAGDLGLIPGLGRSPEKEMATHSSILAWEIPWTEEPGGLQPMGSQRVIFIILIIIVIILVLGVIY